MQRLPGLSAKRILLFLAVPLVIYFAFATGGKALQAYHLKQEENRILQEIEGLKAQYLVLQEYKDYVQSVEYIEKIARMDLGFIKPGETAVIVLAPPSLTSIIEELPSAVEEREEPPVWKRWWDFLLGH